MRPIEGCRPHSILQIFQSHLSRHLVCYGIWRKEWRILWLRFNFWRLEWWMGKFFPIGTRVIPMKIRPRDWAGYLFWTEEIFGTQTSINLTVVCVRHFYIKNPTLVPKNGNGRRGWVTMVHILRQIHELVYSNSWIITIEYTRENWSSQKLENMMMNIYLQRKRYWFRIIPSIDTKYTTSTHMNSPNNNSITTLCLQISKENGTRMDSKRILTI